MPQETIPSKEELIENINNSLGNPAQGRNSMGCSESFYNPYYLVGKSLKDKKIDIQTLTKGELLCMIIVAEYASEVFY